MARLTDKQGKVDWPEAIELMRDWQEDLHSNMTNEKFIDLYVGTFNPQETKKEDDRLRK